MADPMRDVHACPSDAARAPASDSGASRSSTATFGPTRRAKSFTPPRTPKRGVPGRVKVPSADEQLDFLIAQQPHKSQDARTPRQVVVNSPGSGDPGPIDWQSASSRSVSVKRSAPPPGLPEPCGGPDASAPSTGESPAMRRRSSGEVCSGSMVVADQSATPPEEWTLANASSRSSGTTTEAALGTFPSGPPLSNTPSDATGL